MQSPRKRGYKRWPLIICVAWLGVACKQPGEASPPASPAPRVPAAESPPIAPPAEPAPSQAQAPAAAKAPTTPLEVTTALFAALRAADGTALNTLARLPFRLRDTGSEGDCKSGDAESTDQLSSLVQCLLFDSLLLGDLKEHPQLLVEEIGKRDLPPWTKKWRKELVSGDKLVHVMAPGNGNTFHFIAVNSGDGVHGSANFNFPRRSSPSKVVTPPHPDEHA